jgi:hypothetical protein
VDPTEVAWGVGYGGGDYALLRIPYHTKDHGLVDYLVNEIPDAAFRVVSPLAEPHAYMTYALFNDKAIREYQSGWRPARCLMTQSQWVETHMDMRVFKGTSASGDSGTPVAAAGPSCGAILPGLVVGRVGDHGLIAPIYRHAYNVVVSKLVAQTNVPVNTAVLRLSPGPLSHNSDWGWLEKERSLSGVVPIGTLSGVACRTMSSKVAPNSYGEFFSLKSDKGPPVLSDRMVDGVRVGPFRKNHNDLASLQGHFTLAEVREAASVVLSNPKFKGHDVFPLTLNQTINGIYGDKFINRMNMSTSSGYPTFTQKKNFFTFDADGVATPKESLIETLAAEAAHLARGAPSKIVFDACSKDEPCKKSKQPRIFLIVPIEASMLIRSILLPWFVMLQKQWKVLGCVIGLNAYSYQMHEMYKWLADFSKWCFTGDYESYDSHLDPWLEYFSYYLYKGLIERDPERYAHWTSLEYARAFMAKEFGVPAEWVTKTLFEMAVSLLACLAFPVYLSSGDVTLVSCSGSSGVNVTTQDNSYKNLCMMIIAYSKLGLSQPFFRMVRCVFYGDDNALAVRTKKFDFDYVHTFLASRGMSYTRADKSAGTYSFHPPIEIDFLKRTMRWSEDFECYVGQLSLKSIAKMLQWKVRSDAMDSLEQDRVLVDASLVELFLHGRKV